MRVGLLIFLDNYLEYTFKEHNIFEQEEQNIKQTIQISDQQIEIVIAFGALLPFVVYIIIRSQVSHRFQSVRLCDVNQGGMDALGTAGT